MAEPIAACHEVLHEPPAAVDPKCAGTLLDMFPQCMVAPWAKSMALLWCLVLPWHKLICIGCSRDLVQVLMYFAICLCHYNMISCEAVQGYASLCAQSLTCWLDNYIWPDNHIWCYANCGEQFCTKMKTRSAAQLACAMHVIQLYVACAKLARPYGILP